uniref:Uncharacterized protein n=1 Tax=Pseudomonas phage PACT201 TaxID=3230130 RepID=A0AAU8GSN0_9VIRU
MSVQSNTYVLVGVKLNYQEFKDRYLGDDEEGYDQYVDPYSDSAYKGIQHHDGPVRHLRWHERRIRIHRPRAGEVHRRAWRRHPDHRMHREPLGCVPKSPIFW